MTIDPRRLSPSAPAGVNSRPARRAVPPVRQSLSKMMAELARQSGALDPDLIERWEEIAGPDIAALCRPVGIKRQKGAETLVVSAPNGAAAMKVQFSQGAIIARAAQYLGRRNLTRLMIEQKGARPSRWKSQKVDGAAMLEAQRVAAAAEPPPTSLDEALARLGRSVAHRSAGTPTES